MSSTQYFYELTPDRITHALERAGLRPTPTIRFLNSLENRVVRVEDEDGERWVAKFYRPGRWTAEAIEEEHDFLFELLEADLPVVAPYRFPNGSTLGEVSGIWFTVFPFQPGRGPDEIDLPLAFTLGQLVGRLHALGERGRFRHRPVIGPQWWGLEALASLEKERVVPDDIWPRYSKTVRQLVDRVKDAFSKAKPLRLHGDLHRGNVLITSQGPVLVDFDDTGTGPAVQDVWMLIPSRDEDALELRELFLKGYETARPFDRRTLSMIEALRALKFVHYAAWVARRRKDPAFTRLFPDVESRSYWRRELDELEAQLGMLDTASVGKKRE